MKRFYGMVVCAALLSIPVSPAMAGTWSWHSDIIEKITDMIESHASGSSDNGNRQDNDRRPEGAQDGRADARHDGGIQR